MPPVTAFPIRAEPRHRPQLTLPSPVEGAALRVVPWLDPVADPHGVHPCSRYVELYWLGIIGPARPGCCAASPTASRSTRTDSTSTSSETARSLGLGERMGKNSPFRRALQRLGTFELARSHGPSGLAVRTRIPPLPLRHLSRLPESLQTEPSPVAGRAAPARAGADAPAGPATGRGTGRLRAGPGRDRAASWPRGSSIRRWLVPGRRRRRGRSGTGVIRLSPALSSWPAGVRPQ